MIDAKVKVSKEVAEAIEELYVEYGGKTPARVEVITYDIIRVVEMRKVFGGMRLQDVIKAISDGYEIEQTPAEKVAVYFAEASRNKISNNISLGRVQAVRFIAEAYGLKIEGVNA